MLLELLAIVEKPPDMVYFRRRFSEDELELIDLLSIPVIVCLIGLVYAFVATTFPICIWFSDLQDSMQVVVAAVRNRTLGNAGFKITMVE